MRRIHLLPTAALVLLSCSLLACGNDDASSGTTTSAAPRATTSTTSTTPPAATPGTADDEVAPDRLEFTLETSNGNVLVTGTTDGCTNPSETTLDVTFTDGTQQVVVSATDGVGSVKIPGEFEGTIDSIAVGDLGNVSISGRGGLADDSAEATTFTVVGNCA